MSEDTDVMFRIGVMDHPASRTALQDLAAAVETAQARMTAGVESIGETATRVGGMVDGLANNLDRLRGVASQTENELDGMRYGSGGVRGPDYTPPTSSAPASQPAKQPASPPTQTATQVPPFNRDDLSRSMQNVYLNSGLST